MTRKAILVVEDDPDDRQFIAEALRNCGLGEAAVFFPDGVQALAYLLGGTEPPSLVLLDLMLPKLSGLEVLERLRGDPLTRSTPVVIFTSSSSPEDVGRAYALGANSYVRKARDPKEFESAVADVGRYWTARNVPFDSGA